VQTSAKGSCIVMEESANQHKSYRAVSGNAKVSGNVILEPHPDSDKHQNLTTS